MDLRNESKKPAVVCGPRSRRVALGYAAAYLLITGVACFWRLGQADVAYMEGILADGARYMLRTGDYLVPHLYGRPYTFKPPLAYWLTAGSFSLFNEQSEWSLRFPQALGALLMGGAVFILLSRLLGPRQALLGGVATLISPIVTEKLQVAEFDIPLAMGIALATCAACWNLCAPRSRTSVWIVGYLGLAFGLLAKGCPALMLFGPGLLLAAILARRARRLVEVGHLWGVMVFLVVIGAWILLSYRASGWGFLHDALVEARVRGATWTWRSFGLTLLKPLMILALFLPWSLFIPLTLGGRRPTEAKDAASNLGRSAWGFLIGGTVAFMLVPTQTSRYYLPLAPSVVILASLVFDKGLELSASRQRLRDRLSLVAGVLAAAAAIGVAIYMGETVPWPARIVLGIIGAAGISLTLWLHRRPVEAKPANRLLIASLCIWATFALAIRPARAEARSMRPLAIQFDLHIPASATLWTNMGDSFSSMMFYLQRPVETLSLSNSRPPAGSYLLVTPGQLNTLQARSDLALETRQRAVHGRFEFVLVQVN